jgi:hypothetical protein
VDDGITGARDGSDSVHTRDLSRIAPRQGGTACTTATRPGACPDVTPPLTCPRHLADGGEPKRETRPGPRTDMRELGSATRELTERTLRGAGIPCRYGLVLEHPRPSSRPS